MPLEDRDWIITDDNAQDFVDRAHDEGRHRGLNPRDWKKHPEGLFSPHVKAYPSELMVPESEWPDRLKTQQDTKSSLWDLRELHYDVLKSLDQNGLGLCWAFSSTKSCMYALSKMGSPKKLSPWWVAGKVKRWRDEGGWGAESSSEIASEGAPIYDLCPDYDSRHDTPATRDNALLHKLYAWVEAGDREDMKAVTISAFLLGLAPVLDYDDISHSMCGCRLVSLDPFTLDCDNSWGEDAGNKGCYRRTGRSAVPDGIAVPVAMVPGQG